MNGPTLFRLTLIIVLGLSTSARAEPSTAASPGASVPIYIGTDTRPGTGQGIYLTHLDLAAGTLSAPQLVAETGNPSFLALHPSGKFLFAVSGAARTSGEHNGSVTGFAIDSGSGKLTPINQQSSAGLGPCYVSIGHDGKYLFVANYAGGSFAVIPVDGDGKLGEPSCVVQDDLSNPKQPPHGHCIQFDPTGKFVVADDLGLDKILVFHFDSAAGVLTANDPPGVDTLRGAGPRHLAFHPNGKWAYNINELNSTMSAYAWNTERGVLTELQSLSTLPEDFHSKNSCAEVLVHPLGRFLYGSNRGNDSIAIFKIDAETGKLTAAGHVPSGGKTPRNFALDPDGHWLVAGNQDSGNVVVFKVDAETGELKPNGKTILVPTPMCVMFAPIPR